MRLDYHPLLLSVRERLAKLIGAQTGECVMVPNASSAAAIILRGLQWKAGDTVIASMSTVSTTQSSTILNCYHVSVTTTYANVANAVQFIHDLRPEVRVSSFKLAFPATHADIIKSFKDHLKTVQRPNPTAENPDPKVFCVVDSIISNPGIVLPWKEMVEICRAEGIYSIVDAAHSIGQEVNLNLTEAQPDFWFSVRILRRLHSRSITYRRRTVTNGCMRSDPALFYTCLNGECTIYLRRIISVCITSQFQKPTHDTVGFPYLTFVRFPRSASTVCRLDGYREHKR